MRKKTIYAKSVVVHGLVNWLVYDTFHRAQEEAQQQFLLSISDGGLRQESNSHKITGTSFLYFAGCASPPGSKKNVAQWVNRKLKRRNGV